MSTCAVTAVLAISPGLRDNGIRNLYIPFYEAFPLMAPDEKEGGISPGLTPLSSLSSLLKRSKEGDHAAMEAIYENFRGAVYNLAYRYTGDRTAAEDILQDTFVKIFTHLGDVRKEETFPAWLYRIALNTCYSYLRSRKSRDFRTVPLSEVEGKAEEAARNGHAVSIRVPLDEAIQELPEKLRMVFLLHDVQGFKHEEIAKTLGCTTGTSKSQLFKARLKIREFLKAKKAL
jgi:RNA polymerase sigma-70 factor (ECF subfamily)